MRALTGAAAALALAALAAAGARGATRCPPDSVLVGPTCIDRYEGSVWLVPEPTTGNRRLVEKIQQGKVTLEELQAAGATQLGITFMADSYPSDFPSDGDWVPLFGTDPPTPGIYAASVAGVPPSRLITWAQADQACTLSGKRLPTNQEWQVAAAGTPDPGVADDGATTCVTAPQVIATGARSACVSVWGAHDMVGNAGEWVGDWGEVGPTNVFVDCTTFLGDESCFGGPNDQMDHRPGAPVRGRGRAAGAAAGVFAVGSDVVLSASQPDGFRCARDAARK